MEQAACSILLSLCYNTMITFKNLFEKIISYENLLRASYQAAAGKREKPYVMSFFLNWKKTFTGSRMN
jgi:hypothetical protein